MEEPQRLKDQEGSDLERALLRAGTSYRGSKEARLRTLLALGLAGTLSGIAGNASASVLAKSSWYKIIALSAIGAAVSVPVVRNALSDESAVEPARATSIAAAVPAKPASPAPLEPAAEPQAAPEPELLPLPDQAARATALGPVDAPAERGDRAKLQPLRSELAMLDDVRLAIAGGEVKRALGLLDGYAKSYPGGRMRVEAEVLRIDALAKSGQTERARARARAFLKRRPNSVFAARVQSYL